MLQDLKSEVVNLDNIKEIVETYTKSGYKLMNIINLSDNDENGMSKNNHLVAMFLPVGTTGKLDIKLSYDTPNSKEENNE